MYVGNLVIVAEHRDELWSEDCIIVTTRKHRMTLEPNTVIQDTYRENEWQSTV